MSENMNSKNQDTQSPVEDGATRRDWKTTAKLYALREEQRAAELALINSVQEGLSARLEMQAIYDLVGDKLRDTFNAQIVMISQYDPNTHKVFHHYAIEKGVHLHIPAWMPMDVSRDKVIRTRKPVMIGQAEIDIFLATGQMRVIPGTQTPKSWLGVPMIVGDEVRGLVSLQNLDDENAFSQSDVDLLMTLTNSMALSLENARLFNETERLLKVIRAEMEIARQTQRSILPMRLPRRSGYDFGSFITPARAVGGDFYDFIHLDKDHLCMVIGDVSDKGLPAALFMALTFSLLRAETEHSQDIGQVLHNVNRYMLKMNASDMYVTLLYGILDCRTGELRYARAGHLPPIILGSNGGPVEVPVGFGQPLGLFEDVELDLQSVTIPPRGLALMFSDGLNEASDSEGREFGYKRIRHTLDESRQESARVICKRLWQAVKSYSGDSQQHDDFTAVVIKRQA